MDSTVIVALIALAGTIVSGVISAIISGRLTNYRIEQLEAQMKKHNNLLDRMYRAEEDISLIQKDIQQIKEDK